MTTLFFGILTFFLHALVLKIAVGTMGVPASRNTYSKALSIAFALSLAGFLIGFIPLVSWLIYAVLWIAVIMSAYDLGLFKSLGVAVVQVGLKIVVWMLLKLFTFDVAAHHLAPW